MLQWEIVGGLPVQEHTPQTLLPMVEFYSLAGMEFDNWCEWERWLLEVGFNDGL